MVQDPYREKSLEAGLKLASPEPGEEVVIAGMAGRFPDSDDIYHFRENLFNKIDMVSGDDRRWHKTHPEIPQRTGKINMISKFDAGFFGVHKKQAGVMDPMCRNLLERAYEAILDAGLNPHELKGSNTGVFVGACYSEVEMYIFFQHFVHQCFGIMGCTRSMLAQRLSYWLGLNGPSCIYDTACSSSLFALDSAYKYIRDGRCNMAIVAGCNLCLHPIVSLQFARLGVLSTDGACKSFDESANGYARSEAICVIVLQKSKDAKRIYAKILHSKTNCDGYKEQGITYPSGKIQKVLLEEFYEECRIPPNTLSFVEAHGTGTKVGDPEELGTLDEIFCTGRDQPLLIGSVKSNIGHNEPVSGLCSMVKAVIGMESGFIPPNIHFKTPRVGVTALEEGRMKVVEEKTRLPNDPVHIGINNFGFGGANAHLLLEWNKKRKINKGLPEDDLPRLVCFSSRTPEGIQTIIKDLSSQTLDAEYVRLYHDIFRYDLMGHLYRGYTTLSKQGVLSKSYKFCEQENLPLYIVFGGWNEEISRIGLQLFKIPIFAAHIQKIHDIFYTNNLDINIVKVITDFDSANLLNRIIGTIAIQTGLIEIFNSLKLKLTGCFGSSIGELSRAYMENLINLKEILFIAFNYTNNNNGKQDLILKEQLEKLLTALENTKKINLPKEKSFLLKIGEADILQNHQTESIEVVSDVSLGLHGFFESLGRLYEKGYSLALSNLYPNIEWPVARGTPMISPLIKWDYSKNYLSTIYITEESIRKGKRVIEIGITDNDWQFIKGHVIDGDETLKACLDGLKCYQIFVPKSKCAVASESVWKQDFGRILFPATGYLVLVWETLAMMRRKLMNNMKVVFENVKFSRACTFPPKGRLELVFTVEKGEGNFEIVEGETLVVTGRIYEDEKIDRHWTDLPLHDNKKNEILLSSKEIYKELRLRGYNYKHEFKAVKGCNLTATKGTVEWNANFITFMDNMLQLQILHVDSRNLYVPTRIDKLIVDPIEHIKHVQNIGGTKPDIPVYIYKDLRIIRSGAIEIRGMYASSISKKKTAQPVLEVYKFVPNETKLPLDVSVRVLMQVAIENEPVMKVKAVELIDEETQPDSEVLSPFMLQALADQPLIQADLTLITKEDIVLPGIKVDDRKIASDEADLYCVVGSQLLERFRLRSSIFTVLTDTGFIISRESIHYNPNTERYEDIDIICIHTTPKEKLVLLRKKSTLKPQILVNMSGNVDGWFNQVQNAFKNEDSNIILHTQDDEKSGILGFTNCARREPNGSRVRCVFIQDKLPKFRLEDEFYQQQLMKNLAINVFKHGSWGTYRHFLFKDDTQVKCENCYVNVAAKGDLSSLKWFEGKLNTNSPFENEQVSVHVYCASINFRDIMIASGRIQSETITKNRLEQDCVLGFEFAGRDKSGKRVMGMTPYNAMATIVLADTNLLWDVPDQWSLEEAATVPAVYGTVLYALIIRGQLKKGQTILIHSATGGVGQAAIHVALHVGCTIFATVGTEEKREFLKQHFLQIQPANIGNSRDVTFEEQILKRTYGRGVDMVLNSLADDKMQASVRCLAQNGKFVEIGKFDLQNNTNLSTDLVEKGGSFIGVMLDALFEASPKVKCSVADLLREGIAEGFIKPLTRTSFQSTELEEAFRFMATGKHIGKVIISVKKEEIEKRHPPNPTLYNAVPRFSSDPHFSYVIIGGLGGFGLELTDWLVVRGARKLVLVSRKGLSTSYQQLRITTWKSYGAAIIVLQENVTTLEGTESLLHKANNFGPVAAIFNLAVVLKDSILENQTLEMFNESCNPKAVATKYLDVISERLCPQLQYFVVFSSVSCGRGNAGQTNYGLGNSIMERICEDRNRRGLPGLAIQWGAIGDVGLVAQLQEEQTELVIGGTLQQKISSCLEVLDKFLRQDDPIVSSMVVAEKRGVGEVAGNMVDAVVYILGLRDLKTVSLHSTLPELGMDSMMAVEIKQTLEREYEVFLSPQDIRTLTFARLQEISQEKIDGTDENKKDFVPSGLKLLLRFVANEDQSDLRLIKMPTAISDIAEKEMVFMLPGIEGTVSVFESLAKNLKVHAMCAQFSSIHPEDSIQEMASNIFPLIKEKLGTNKNFTILAYSFGTIVGLELAALLEYYGYTGKLVFIDGAPTFLKKLIENQLAFKNEAEFETNFICSILSLYLPYDIVDTYKSDLLKCDSFAARLELALNLAPKNLPHGRDHLTNVCIAGYKRMKNTYTYEPSFDNLETPVYLYRPIDESIKLSEDYELSSVTKRNVQVDIFKGNHLSILDNIHVSNAINDLVTRGKDNEIQRKITDLQEFPDIVKHTVK